MNPQDVMLLVKVKINEKSGIDLSAMDDKNRAEVEKDNLVLLSIELVSKGCEITQFKIGQKVSMKSKRSIEVYDKYSDDDTERIVVTHAGNIAYAK